MYQRTRYGKGAALAAWLGFSAVSESRTWAPNDRATEDAGMYEGVPRSVKERQGAVGVGVL